MTIPTCEIQPMNKLTSLLSASTEVLPHTYVTHRPIGPCCNRSDMSGYIVDESSLWNSESAGHARSLRLAILLHLVPLLFPSCRPTTK